MRRQTMPHAHTLSAKFLFICAPNALSVCRKFRSVRHIVRTENDCISFDELNSSCDERMNEMQRAQFLSRFRWKNEQFEWIQWRNFWIENVCRVLARACGKDEPAHEREYIFNGLWNSIHFICWYLNGNLPFHFRYTQKCLNHFAAQFLCMSQSHPCIRCSFHYISVSRSGTIFLIHCVCVSFFFSLILFVRFLEYIWIQRLFVFDSFFPNSFLAVVADVCAVDHMCLLVVLHIFASTIRTQVVDDMVRNGCGWGRGNCGVAHCRVPNQSEM